MERPFLKSCKLKTIVQQIASMITKQ